MERQYNQITKETYSKELASQGYIDEAKRIIAQDDYLPITQPIDIHPESEVNHKDINQIFKYIGTDLDIVNSSVSIASARFRNLLETTRTKLSAVKKKLNTEKERQEDINILCNKYTNFSNIILLSDVNNEGDAVYSNNAFMLPNKNYTKVQGEILEVTGNGYAGNNYVYSDNDFLQTVKDTSNTQYMVDNSLLTYFEYSRITASNSEKDIFPYVNFDSIHARCSVLIKASTAVNTLELTMETSDVVIESLSTSMDGITFTESSLKDVAINDKYSRFSNKDYIFGSGLLSFKDCLYIKLTLRATKYSNDTIAFTKKDSNNTDNIIKLNTAKRSVIRINEITLSKKEYTSSAQIKLSNFLTDNASSLAIFANEYIADSLSIRNCVTYTLTVNGIDYEVIPINSQNNGKKVVRTTNSTIAADHVHYLTEKAKNATLTISMKTTAKEFSPFISDLKILIGGE